MHNFKTPVASQLAGLQPDANFKMRRKFKQMNQCSTTTLLYYFVILFCGLGLWALFIFTLLLLVVWWYGLSTNRLWNPQTGCVIHSFSTNRLWNPQTGCVIHKTFNLAITIHIEYYFESARAYTAQLITLLYFSWSQRFKSRSVQKKYFFCFSLLSSRIETIH